VWRFKYLLIGMLFPALIGLAAYISAPRLTDAVKDRVRDSAAQSVENTFDRETPNRVSPGQIVITQRRLAQVINDPENQDQSWHINGMDVVIADGEVRLVSDNGDADNSADIFAVTPAIQNGQFVLTQRHGFLNIFKTAQDSIADEIEVQTNTLFQQSGVVPVSVTAENGRLVIVTKAGGGSTGQTPTATNSAGGTTGSSLTPTSASGLGSLLNPHTPTPTP
jgi:hypothetical protein